MFVNNKINNQYIKYWLLTLFFLIISIIIIGGLTRLTDSGLSITEWELFSGLFPPLNNNKWEEYFNLYKKIPEFYLINKSMTLNEFKVIFYWEYIHRLIARIIGLVSIIPLLYFTFKYKYFFRENKKYYILFLLICFQGFIGWYMVKSGLVNNVDVSHFRLATHLIVAFLIFSIVLWFLLQIYDFKKFTKKISNFLLSFFLIFIVLQILLGGFLSGLDGGLIYNTWPDMNGYFFPDDLEINEFLSINSFSQASAVQFLHRNIAYLIVFILFFLNINFYINKNNSIEIYLINLFVFLQIILGILTLVTGVEIKFASLHQLGSLFVLGSTIILIYRNQKHTNQQL